MARHVSINLQRNKNKGKPGYISFVGNKYKKCNKHDKSWKEILKEAMAGLSWSG